ncbi:CDP-glycerol glycerophosphotransferase family protein [Halobacillus sp. B29]|uniref:CDP-glycerol glycerophosphotransferase family protein n=1 Tax=Halobacillus sp. B29 TaxID=3457432 RepID=UPI003FCD4D32
MNTIKKIMSFSIIYLFNCLPIKNNKIFLFSYYGSQFGCNPKYITQYLLEHEPEGKFDIIWAFNDPGSQQIDHRIRKVKVMSLKYFYELCTSKVIVTNYRTTDLFVKRKGQYYIQTWHSSLRLKQIEKDAQDVLPEHYLKMAQKDSKKCDLLISGSKYSTQIFNRSFWYNGEILEKGTPRNDIFSNNELKQNIKKKLKLSDRMKIVLYAPTFRKNNDMSVYELDYAKLINTLKEEYGGEWKVLVKFHPHLISEENRVSKHNVMDVTEYNDIQELLHISDVLITDYSSLMFDFSITERPCFLFVPDLKSYTKQDRKLYFQMEELPYGKALSNSELLEEIMLFDEKSYKRNLRLFLNTVGTFEKGNASEELMKRINKICFSEKGREVHEAV